MGADSIDREQLHKSMENLDMSKDEMDKFQKAFKDPEFLKMFAEYAQEISDPKNRQETDMYLRQLEAESRVEEVYGKGVQLIVPEAGFVVKTADKKTGRKTFINICYSEKVEPCKGRKTSDPKHPSKTGTSWDIPLSLGKPKSGTDKKGSPCDIYDFVVHPNTKELAVRDARFRSMLVETAIENIEKNFDSKLERSWKQPKMTYKGVDGAEQPHAMAVRTGPAALPPVDGRLRPMPQSGDSEIKRAVGDQAKTATAVPPKEKPVGSACNSASGSASPFKFPAKTKKVRVLKPNKPGDIGYKYPSGEVCPQYQVVERGCVDMAMAWADAGRGLDVTGNVPQSMVLRVELPGCTSAAGMELDLEKNSIDLRIPGKFRLERVLPHVVDDSKAKAKFDKAQQCLEVTLPVVPPKPKVPLHVFSDGASSVGEQQQLVAEIPAHDSAARDGVDGNRELQDGPEGPLIHSEAQDEPGAALMTKDASEVKRQWEEVMRKHDGEVRANQATSLQDDRQQQQMKDQKGNQLSEAAAAGQGEFIAASSFQGECQGYKYQMGEQGLGYYKDRAQSSLTGRASTSKSRAAAALAGAGIAAPSSASPVTTKAGPPKLRPRLNNSLAEELD